jgi:sister-chromatid-cohesion protein PDS5
MSTMSMFLRRSSLRILNQSSIPTLVKRVQKGDGSATSQAHLAANNAQILLSFTSKHCPALYKPHIGELTKAIADEKNPRLVEICLQALSSAVKWDSQLASNDKSGPVNLCMAILPPLTLMSCNRKTNERIMRYVLESRPRHAKFAVRLLACSRNSDEVCTQIVEVGYLSHVLHSFVTETELVNFRGFAGC